MTNVESMDYTHSHLSSIASLSCAAQVSSVPYTHLIPSSKQSPYLPIMTSPLPFRDILPCNFHHSVYYDTLHHCHIALHDHVVDIVFVAKPPFIIFSYMSLMSHCISRSTAGGIHIESYLVLSIEL
mgnify:CR=1 FL=1